MKEPSKQQLELMLALARTRLERGLGHRLWHRDKTAPVFPPRLVEHVSDIGWCKITKRGADGRFAHDAGCGRYRSVASLTPMGWAVLREATSMQAAG